MNYLAALLLAFASVACTINLGQDAGDFGDGVGDLADDEGDGADDAVPVDAGVGDNADASNHAVDAGWGGDVDAGWGGDVDAGDWDDDGDLNGEP